MNQSSPVRVRFAPSPTGTLHIGSVRTALFNYLFAKKHQGQFVLRIEDTDRTRSTRESEAEIMAGLRWVGLDWDCGPIDADSTESLGDLGPYRQTERLAIYQRYIKQMLKTGAAYERNGAIWLRIPEARRSDPQDRIRFYDLIRGEVSVPTETIEDFVIVKSDGIPLFLLTNVIDDHEMGITHVIRGEDHISNTHKQILIAETLGLNSAKYAHIPLILNPDRSKMSKRLGSTATLEFKQQGYLPAAIINFLAFLGWSPGTDREIFSLDELAEAFSIERVGKSAAVFNVDRLDYLNAYYIRQTPADELAANLLPDFWSVDQLGPMPAVDDPYFLTVLNLVKERMVQLTDFVDLARYFYQEPKYGAKLLVYKKSTDKRTLLALEATIKRLKLVGQAWASADELRQVLASIVKANELDNGDLYWPVRVALSGAEFSPAPEQLLQVLGKERSLSRLESALTELRKP